ncbi:MAG: pilus assembly protein [Rhodospirillales bacterium 70-18]|nr:MAG: pilus assembly protein [Rhodospirillales bacterium 70-18]
MTWSILVRDPATGALGAAVASRFFAVGAICIHVEGGVGAMSTQALVNPLHAIAAMPRLRAGEAPQAIVDSLLEGDPGRLQRQVHILDARGRLAQHTGPDCVTWAGMVKGENVSVAGNMLAGPQVVQATLDAFVAATGSLVERLLTAMEAGEAAGGDKRGKQSAALKVCTADPYPDLDIRSDDHPDPLAELRRLHRVSLVRYAVFRRHMPGRDHPWGSIDRAVVEADITAHGQPLP